jgi:hypothetical protein
MEYVADPQVDQLKAPYAERWELLKDVIVRLFVDEQNKLKDVVKIMEIEYKFYAS